MIWSEVKKRMIKRSIKDFGTIVEDILSNDKFQKLNNELHHGISRFSHSRRVASLTYRFAKLFHMKNIEAMTRAALLHDFYLDNEFINNENSAKKLSAHPILAYENASQYYELGDLEENIIKSHMFPLKGDVPVYKESYIVSTIDKLAGAYEMSCFKFSLALNILLIFIFNIITIQR